MGLGIYALPDVDAKFSSGGLNTSPMRFSVDGRIGDKIERLYYVRNDDATKTYTNVAVSIIPSPVIDIVNGDDGYGIKLKVGSAQPTEQEWDSILLGNTISINGGNVGSTAIFHPFWVRIEIPAGAPVQTITGMSVRVSGTAS